MSSPILLSSVSLNREQQDCLDKLLEAVEQVKKGNIDAIAVVCCMKKGYAHFVGGKRAPELNLGLDSLKRVILDRIERPALG